MANKKPEKIFHIAVVGMSGTEVDRGATGVGKSCLCNRFMRPHADDYFTDHISVISSSDFSGRIVNNDHFLYWGETMKKCDGDNPMTFRVIEQTEFIDDSSFSPLRGSNTHNYHKRATVTKLNSAEKVMYICKDQVGDETNFTQRILPDGKFLVDGFLLIFDVSKAKGHEKQMEFLTKLHGQISKAKRPVVVVATKWDEGLDSYVRDARTFANKIKAPLIETSAQEGVNVDLAFCTLACIIDKRGKPREVSYQSANETRTKLINRCVEDYENLLKSDVTNYHELWTSKKKQYMDNPVFQEVVKQIGTKNAKTHFGRHTRRLRQNHQQKKLKLYLSRLPDALEDIFPDLSSISGRDWTECRYILPQMRNFEKWFIILPKDQTWRESEYIDTDQLLIPYDLLEGNETECENCFQDHVNRLNAAKRKERMKEEFKELLASLHDIVLPNRPMEHDLIQEAIKDKESFRELDEDERTAIYGIHQGEIKERALEDFAELLSEKWEMLANVDVTQNPKEEVDKLEEQLQNEPRYQKLSEMSMDRYVMLIKRLAFVQNPTTESCYYSERCMEKLIQYCIERNAQKSPIKDQLGSWDDSNHKLNIIILGEDGLADELESEITAQSFDGDYTLDKVLYSLDLKTIEGDITQPNNQLVTDRFTPQGFICVFTSLEGFQYVKSSLEKTILSDEEEYSSSTLRNLAVVLMFGRSTSPEADTAQVREQAERLCSRLSNCQIVNVPPDNHTLWQGKKFSVSQIQDAIRSVVAGQKYQSGTPNQTESDNGVKGESSFRIGLCMTCGDPFQPDLVLNPVTSHTCVITPNEENCITCDMFLIDTKCRVDFEISSYHLAGKLRERVHHGYILVYAAQRKASLESLRWFLKMVTPIPVLVVAVCEDIAYATEGIAEGNRLVDATENAKLVTASCSSFSGQTVVYNSFLRDAYDKRRATEMLFKDTQPPLSPGDRPPLELPLSPASISEGPGDVALTPTESAIYAQVERRPSEPRRPSVPSPAPSPFLPDEELYATVDKNRNEAASRSTSESFLDDSALYAEVKRDHKTSTPDPRYRLDSGSGWIDNTLYDSYPSPDTKPLSPRQGIGAEYESVPVGHYRGSQSEESEEGLVDNPLYSSWTASPGDQPKPVPKKKPPTLPKPKKLDLSKYPVRTEALIRPLGNINRPNDLPVRHHHRRPQPPPFASPESDESAGYASPADALPFHQFGGGIGSSRLAGIYAQPHDHLPRGTTQKVRQVPQPTPPSQPRPAPGPRPSPRPGGYDSIMELESDAQKRPRQDKPTPLRKIDGNKAKIVAGSKESFLEGLEKLLKVTMDPSYQEPEPDINSDEYKRKRKEEMKNKKKEEERRKKLERKRKKDPYPAMPKKPPKPPLEQLQLTENGVPSFIEQCVNRLEAEGIEQEGIYRVSGKAADIDLIIKAFDENQNTDLNTLENLSTNTVASALKQFFKSLPDPIIPYSTQEKMIEQYKEADEDTFVEMLPEFLSHLTHVKRTVLQYMMKHMKRITEYSELNLMNAENLSICWWPSMLHPQSTSFEDLANEALLAAVFKLILENSQELFS